jgi:hypothetical protein
MRTPDTDITITGQHLQGTWKAQEGVWVMVFVVNGRTYTQTLMETSHGMPPAAGELEPSGLCAFNLLQGAERDGFLVLYRDELRA